MVDDSSINLLTAKKALDESYRVFTMPSAMKMFSILEKITPDLILLDIEMPGMDGFEALRCLKLNPLHADIPIVFLTGYIDAATKTRAFELGAVDFITKPFSAPELLNSIGTHLNID